MGSNPRLDPDATPTTERRESTLVVAISSRALFDLGESHALFEREGVDAFARYQIAREDELLAPGIAFPLVQKLLRLNRAPPEAPHVEVILLSRNSADTGLRIFNSIEHYGLDIVRAAFTRGESTLPYINAFGADLFLSANPDSVAQALASGVAAATILPSKTPQRQIRPAAHRIRRRRRAVRR